MERKRTIWRTILPKNLLIIDNYRWLELPFIEQFQLIWFMHEHVPRIIIIRMRILFNNTFLQIPFALVHNYQEHIP